MVRYSPYPTEISTPCVGSPQTVLLHLPTVCVQVELLTHQEHSSWYTLLLGDDDIKLIPCPWLKHDWHDSKDVQIPWQGVSTKIGFLLESHSYND